MDSKYKARIAERELALKDEIAKLAAVGEFEKAQELEQQLANERERYQAELEEKKETVRAGKG